MIHHVEVIVNTAQEHFEINVNHLQMATKCLLFTITDLSLINLY